MRSVPVEAAPPEESSPILLGFLGRGNEMNNFIPFLKLSQDMQLDMFFWGPPIRRTGLF